MVDLTIVMNPALGRGCVETLSDAACKLHRSRSKEFSVGDNSPGPFIRNRVQGMRTDPKGAQRVCASDQGVVQGEDDVLKRFLEYVIRRYCSPTFFSYQIIMIGPGGQAIGLMRKNRHLEFLGPKESVITILDGDIRPANPEPGIHYIPLPSVEKALFTEYHQPGFPHSFEGGALLKAKVLHSKFIDSKILSSEEIFGFLCDKHNGEIEQFAQMLKELVCRPIQ